jgi:hypothetical protein
MYHFERKTSRGARASTLAIPIGGGVTLDARLRRTGDNVDVGAAGARTEVDVEHFHD